MASSRPYVRERRQWLLLGLGETFAFFAEPTNLPRITPPWLGFRILTPPPLVMSPGLTIDYRVRVMGWPVHWRSRISEYDPPRAFRDVQLVGPYRTWDHMHRFWRRTAEPSSMTASSTSPRSAPWERC